MADVPFEEFKPLKNMYSEIGFNILQIFNSSRNKHIRTKDLYEVYCDVFGEIPWISFMVTLGRMRERGWFRKYRREYQYVEWEANPLGLKHLTLMKKIRDARAESRRTGDRKQVLFLNKYFREVVLKNRKL